MAKRFKEDYKNEIPNDGVRLYDLADKNGNKIESNVKLVRSNGNKQEGDVFGATEVNAIDKFLNGLLEGTETVAKADNADKMHRLGLGGGYLPLSSDCLAISLDGAYNGKLERVNAYTEGTKNCPTSQFIGTKQQFIMAGGWAIVMLYEMYPVAGRTWMNIYNQKWIGWQGFSDDTSVLNAAVSQGVEYLRTHGMNLGTNENPNKPINLFSGDGTYYQLHSTGGYFWIHKFNSANQVIATPFTINGNGIGTVDNARTIVGYKIAHTGIVVNAGGGDTVRIPYPSDLKLCETACPYNSNMDANYSYVESWASRPGYLEVRLNEANGNSIQINTLWLYK